MHPTKILTPVQILAFFGGSGVGKTTIVNALMRLRPELERAISCTTRPRRNSDPPGEYAFLSDQEFDECAHNNAFLWTDTYAGYRYGTLMRTVEDAMQAKYPRIMTLVPDKLAILWNLYPNRVFCIRIATPCDEIIRTRLLARGDNSRDIEKRITMNREWDQKEKIHVPHITITNKETPEYVARGLLEILMKGNVLA